MRNAISARWKFDDDGDPTEIVAITNGGTLTWKRDDVVGVDHKESVLDASKIIADLMKRNNTFNVIELYDGSDTLWFADRNRAMFNPT